MLDAERTQLEAEDTLAQSETTAAIDLIAIYKALGGGWQVMEITDDGRIDGKRESSLSTVDG